MVYLRLQAELAKVPKHDLIAGMGYMTERSLNIIHVMTGEWDSMIVGLIMQIQSFYLSRGFHSRLTRGDNSR